MEPIQKIGESMLAQQKVPYLDGWRGAAILGVLAAHFGPTWAAAFGKFGVLLFFVLSGYFMGGLLFIKQVKLSDFFVRRFSRVVPTFVLFTLAMVAYAAKWQPVPYEVPGSELLATLFFLRTYLPAQQSIWADQWPIGHFWSLNVEEHSYLYLALGVVLLGLRGDASVRRRTLAFLVSSVVLVVGCVVLYGVLRPQMASPWFARTECASLGLLAAAAYRLYLYGVPAQIKSPHLPLFALMLSGLCFVPMMPGGLDKTLAPILAAYAVNHVDQMATWFRAGLSNAVLRWFGLCSFSLYLWQMPFYLLVKHHGGLAWLNLAGAVVLGAISFYGFEDPVRERLNRWWAQRYVAEVVQPQDSDFEVQS